MFYVTWALFVANIPMGWLFQLLFADYGFTHEMKWKGIVRLTITKLISR